ncbi:MAG TPA: hypothetical protein VF611_03865 [Pyrinomonadaceae bacterium]
MERRTDERAATEPGLEESGGGQAGDVRGADEAGGRARFDYGRVLRVAAYALLAGAAALLYLQRFEAAFLVAALGGSAWFLDVRNALIRKHDLVKVGGRNWRPRREVEEDFEEDDEE